MKTGSSGSGIGFVTLVGISGILAGLFLLSIAEQAVAMASHETLATELHEVRRASVNGRDYLTIRIPHSIGPINCHGSVLTLDTAAMPPTNGKALLESVALEAMLTADPVMITVPTDTDQCINGKPTITDMYRLPAPVDGSP